MGKNTSQYNKDYYQKHKKELIEKWKERYHSNPEMKQKILDYQKTYRETHRDKIRKQQRDYWNRKRKEVEQLLGDKCIICDSNKHLQYHEVHGKSHPFSRSGMNYILKHPEDFVPLCGWCHKMIHQIARNTDKLNEILEIVRKIKG